MNRDDSKTAEIQASPQARGLIFDCDGTLADTMPAHWEAWHETFARHGRRCPQAFLEQNAGVSSRGIVKLYNETFGTTLDPVAFAAEKNTLSRIKIADAPPIRPVVALVRRYHGRLPMAVASGGVRVNVALTLRSIDLEACFDAVITADDDVPPKPSPDIFLEAARRLGVSPAHCQVFEDGEAGLIAARRAGMIVTDIRPYLSSGR